MFRYKFEKNILFSQFLKTKFENKKTIIYCFRKYVISRVISKNKYTNHVLIIFLYFLFKKNKNESPIKQSLINLFTFFHILFYYYCFLI